MITIVSPTRIEVDGKDMGLTAPFIRAHPELATEIDAAFLAWHASHVMAVQANDADVAAAKAALAADKANLIAAHAAALESMQADIDTLGTKEEAIAIRAAQVRQQKLQQLAALTAELRLDAEPEPVDLKP